MRVNPGKHFYSCRQDHSPVMSKTSTRHHWCDDFGCHLAFTDFIVIRVDRAETVRTLEPLPSCQTNGGLGPQKIYDVAFSSLLGTYRAARLVSTVRGGKGNCFFPFVSLATSPMFGTVVLAQCAEIEFHFPQVPC